MLNRKPLIWFLIIAFGLAWILFLLPLAFGPPGSTTRQLATTVSWSLAMWAPGLGAIIATRWVAGERLGTLNLRRLGDCQYKRIAAKVAAILFYEPRFT